MLKKAIILAAGKGSRMKSETLKVLHKVAGKPVLQYVVDAVNACGMDEIYIVIGHQGEQVEAAIQDKKVSFVEQKEQLGTGHAVMQVLPQLTDTQDATILVLAGDCPLISPNTIAKLLQMHEESNARATILSTEMKNPASYGRILRTELGNVTGIKEAKDCTAEELKIKEINTGIYAFEKKSFIDALSKITTNNAQGEYYLTDVIHILKGKKEVVDAYCTPDSDQAVGINTRMDLATINQILYQKTNLKHMENGVTIVDPSSTFIDSDVLIGQDTVIEPFNVLRGSTIIGEAVHIKSFNRIENEVIPKNTTLQSNYETIKSTH